MKFTINLALRPYYDQRLVGITMVALLSLMLMLTGIGLAKLMIQSSEISRLRAEINRFDAKIAARPPDVSEKDAKAQQQKIAAINGILSKRPTVWLRLLDTLETSLPDGLSLAKIEYDQKGELFKIEGRTRTINSIQQFLQNLEGTGIYREPLLVSHGELLLGGSGKGYQFVINAKVNLK